MNTRTPTTTTNTIFLNLFDGAKEFPLTVDNLLEAAELYKESAMFASDASVVGTRRIHLTDIIELCIPGKKKLEWIIYNDLFERGAA